MRSLTSKQSRLRADSGWHSLRLSAAAGSGGDGAETRLRYEEEGSCRTECTLLSHVQPNLAAGLNKPSRTPAAASLRRPNERQTGANKMIHDDFNNSSNEEEEEINNDKEMMQTGLLIIMSLLG